VLPSLLCWTLHRSPIAQARDSSIIRIDEQDVAACRFWLLVHSDGLSRRSPPPARELSAAYSHLLQILCYGLFGGLSPLAATWLVERSGNEIAPAFLIMASAAVTAATLVWSRETCRASVGALPSATAGGAAR